MHVIPPAMRNLMVIKYHDFARHFGVNRTVARLRESFYFPGICNYVKRHIRACIECVLARNKVGRQAREQHVIPTGKKPWEIGHVDHLGPFVSTTCGNKYIFTIVCNLSEFTQLYAVKSVKSLPTVEKF